MKTRNRDTNIERGFVAHRWSDETVKTSRHYRTSLQYVYVHTIFDDFFLQVFCDFVPEHSGYPCTKSICLIEFPARNPRNKCAMAKIKKTTLLISKSKAVYLKNNIYSLY